MDGKWEPRLTLSFVKLEDGRRVWPGNLIMRKKADGGHKYRLPTVEDVQSFLSGDDYRCGDEKLIDLGVR